MGLLNIFRGQLAQVIEWKSPEPEQLWYRFPSKLDEIKDASKLIVAPGQGALLVYEGKIVEVILCAYIKGWRVSTSSRSISSARHM